MEKVSETKQAKSVRFIECTPDQLSVIADVMRLQAKQATLPGQVIVYPFDSQTMLVFDPMLTEGQYARLKGSNVDLPNSYLVDDASMMDENKLQ